MAQSPKSLAAVARKNTQPGLLLKKQLRACIKFGTWVPLQQNFLSPSLFRSEVPKHQPRGPLCGPPTSTDQCKDTGWMNFNHPRGFTDQGDCLQYVLTGK